MDAHRPDRRRLPGDARHRVQRLRAGRAETAVRRPAAGHAAVALAGLRADRAGGRRQPGHHDHDHQPPLADRACRRRLAHLPADLVRPAAGGRGAVRADVRLDPRRPLGVRVVHRRRLGRADPGPAQPDDPVAGDRHGPARPLPVQRRAGQSVTSLKPTQVGGGPAGQVRPARPARPGAPGPVGRWRAAAPAILRRHWLAAALLAAGLVLRVLTLLAYRPALFYIDTTRYLYDAQGMDPVGYKGPLRAILLVANFNAVAAVQHLLGLAMAVVIYLLLLRRGVPRWLAALAIAPVLLDAYQLQQEQAVMPGTWFEALIVAGLAILLWPPRTSWRAVVAGGVVLGTSAIFAQVGEALILPAVIYLLAAGGGWRQAIGKAAALCAAFALPILAYSTGSLLLTGDFFLSHSGVTSFYGRMAAAADCAALRLPPAERAMCPSPAQQARGSDWLEYGDGSPIRPYYSGLPRDETDRLITDFNRRVLTQQPQRVAAAYGRDVLKVFALTRATSQGDTPIARWQFQTAYPYYPPHATEQIVAAATARFGGGAPAVWPPVAGFLRSYQLGGGYAPGPVLALCTLAGLAGSAALLRRRAGPGIRQPALACLLFLTSGAALLLVSDLFEFSWRYQLPALVTLVPAGALGITVIVRWARTRRGSARVPGHGGPGAGGPAGSPAGDAAR